MPRVRDVDALGCGQEGSHPHVNPGDRTSHGKRDRLDFDGDDNEPAGPSSGTLTLHGHLPQGGALRECPVQANLNMAHPHHIQLLLVLVELDACLLYTSDAAD